MLPTLEQLEVLEAVVDTGSFAAAGDQLGRATSSVSYAVRTLETTLELRLFDRSGHRAVLTPAGALILEEARAVLREAHDLALTASQLRDGWEAELAVVLDGIIPLAPVMRAMRRFQAEELPTRVGLRTEYLAGVPETFARDEADLMLALEVEDPSDLVTHPLPPIPMILVAHPDHPLHRERGPIPAEAFRRHVELLVADSSRLGPVRSRDLLFGSPHRFQLSDFPAKRQALLEGVGYGWLPGHLAADDLRTGALRELTCTDRPRVTFEPILAHRRSAPPGRGAALFRDLVLEELR
jgi:DNA-binding transcriptional LysR family regulator